jgi:hypothetical protein
MVITIKGVLSLMYLTDLVACTLKMARGMRVTGKMMFIMVRAKKFGLMEANLQVCIHKVRKMVTGVILGLMVQNIRDSG